VICPKCRAAWGEHPYCPGCGWGGGKSSATPDRYQDVARITELESEQQAVIPQIQAALAAMRTAKGLLGDYRYGLTIDYDTNDRVRQQLQDATVALHAFLFSE